MKLLTRTLAVVGLALALSPAYFAQSTQKIDNSPPVHVDDALFADTTESLRRLLTSLEIGTSLIDYRRELLDTKTNLDPLIYSFPKGHQQTDFEEAMRDYIIAADVWETGISYGDEGIPSKTDFYRSLRQRYELKIEPKVGRNIDHHALLRIIWDTAALRIEHAIKVQRSTDAERD